MELKLIAIIGIAILLLLAPAIVWIILKNTRGVKPPRR